MGVLPQAVSTTTTGSVTGNVNLYSGRKVGDNQWVMIYSSTTNPHVWPSGWTELAGSVVGTLYVSVGYRQYLSGDPASIAVSNGGHSANWHATVLNPQSTSTLTVIADDQEFLVNPSSTSMPTPAATGSGAHPTYACLCTAVPTGFYPFLLIGAGPAIVWTSQNDDDSFPSVSLTVGAQASMTYGIAMHDGDSLTYDGNLDDRADYVEWKGYNKYPLQLGASGGGVSVL